MHFLRGLRTKMPEKVHFVITLFGLISIIVLLFSVAALVIHFRILQLRGNADDSFIQVETLIRKQVDLFYDIGAAHKTGSSLCDLCEEADELHAKEVFASLPSIEKELENLKIEADEQAPLKENMHELMRSAEEYNKHTEKYNTFIRSLPGSAMAAIVGLKYEKALQVH